MFKLSNDENTITDIVSCWFPSNTTNNIDTRARKEFVKGLLEAAAAQGELAARKETISKDKNIFIPSPDGTPYIPNMQPIDRYWITASDLKAFLQKKYRLPPAESLLSDWLNLASVEQSENKHPEKIISCRTKNQERNTQCKKWLDACNPDVDSMPKGEIRKALINWANETNDKNLWQNGFDGW